MKELSQIAEELVSLARRYGADEAEASVGEGTEFQVEVRKGKIEHLEEAVSRSMRIRVIKDKRTAHASSSDLSKETIRQLVRQAVKRSEVASQDEFSGLAPLASTKLDPTSLEIFDPKVAELNPAKKIKLARETERLALLDKRITNSHGANFSSVEEHLVLANSNGFTGEYSQTFCTLSVGLQAGDTDNRVEDYWFSAKRFLDDLAPPEAVAEKAIQRTVRHLGPRKIKTRNVPVIFEPTQTAWLLGFLFSCVSGTAVYQKASFLAECLGKKIANNLITVIDDGLIRRAPGTRPFDSDGLPSEKTFVIKQGRLVNFLCNTYAARKLGLKSTASAEGTGVGPTNFYLVPGQTSPEEMIASTAQGLILTRTIGHGLNPVTGDISRGAFGLWVEDGQVVFPVAEVTISGNLGRLLKEVESVGSDFEFLSQIAGPTIKVAEMTVAGQ